jgi:hypothetical protein
MAMAMPPPPMSIGNSRRLFSKTMRKDYGMGPSRRVQVSVSRSVAAPAAKIFQVLADPANHPLGLPAPARR